MKTGAGALHLTIILMLLLLLGPRCATEIDLVGDLASEGSSQSGSTMTMCPAGYYVIEGTPEDDLLIEKWRDDCIIDHGGNDTIIGGSGKDSEFSEVLDRIEVTPANPTITAGRSLQLSATGIFEDGTTADFTSEVAWTSFNTNIATVSFDGLVTGVTSELTTVQALHGTTVGNTIVAVSEEGGTNPATERIEVAPETLTMQVGQSLQLSAVTRFSDESTKDISDRVTWRSFNTNIAGIDTLGLATCVAPGMASISATYEGLVYDGIVVCI